MKKFNIFALTALALAGLTVSCSESDSNANEPAQSIPNTSEGYYLTFEVESDGVTTRNSTTEGGLSNELVAATDKESELNDANIYFLNSNNEVLVALTDLSKDNVVATGTNDKQIQRDNTDKTKHTITVKIDDVKTLLPLVSESSVDIVIVGNKTATGLTYTLNAKTGATASDDNKADKITFDAAFGGLIDKFGTGSDGKTMPLVSFEKKNITTFYGANTADDNNLIPLIDLFNEDYNDGRLLKLTSSGSPIQLERAVARIDFRDRTQAEREDYVKTDDLKNVPYIFQLSDSKVVVKLTNIEVFNINKKSYLFRHVIAGTKGSAYAGTSNSEILLGYENGNSGSDDKYNWVSNPDWNNATAFSDRTLLNPMTGGTETSASIDPSTLTIYTAEGYHPWIYITENTLPTTTMMVPTAEGVSESLSTAGTGIRFKFTIMDKTGTAALDKEKQNLFPDGVSIHDDLLRIVKPDGDYVDLPFDATDTNNCYLVFEDWLKHNNPTTGMDAMEYGIVRNNVYQCKVTGIGEKLLWDELTFYLQLEVKVLPWQKRVNDFKF